MKRRLDLALALVHRPSILFLDEPTTGLDPQSRSALWDEVARLAREDGVTVFLTTQYLEEADVLADRVGIIDHGRLVAEGTPAALKAADGHRGGRGDPGQPGRRDRAREVLGPLRRAGRRVAQGRGRALGRRRRRAGRRRPRAGRGRRSRSRTWTCTRRRWTTSSSPRRAARSRVPRRRRTPRSRCPREHAVDPDRLRGPPLGAAHPPPARAHGHPVCRVPAVPAGDQHRRAGRARRSCRASRRTPTSTSPSSSTFMQAGLFAATTAGPSWPTDIQSGFLNRLQLTPLRGRAILSASWRARCSSR